MPAKTKLEKAAREMNRNHGISLPQCRKIIAAPMPTTPAARQTEKYSYLYHDNGAPFVIIDLDGNDAMLATEDSQGRVILEFKSPEGEAFILRAVNSHAELKAALQAIIKAADAGNIVAHPHKRTEGELLIRQCRQALANAG